MDTQELLTTPARKLTRKQRRARAALKAQMADQLRFLPGYAVGKVRAIDPHPPPLPRDAVIEFPAAIQVDRTYEGAGVEKVGEALGGGKPGHVVVRLT